MEAVKEFVRGTVPGKVQEARKKIEGLSSVAVSTPPESVKRVVMKFKLYLDKYK